MLRNVPVKAAETIGMAQRGGSVTSHVRIGENVSSPLIGRGDADLLVAFEPAEAVRQLVYLKPGGTAVVSTRPIIPVSATTGGPAYDLDAILRYLRDEVEHLVLVDVDEAARELGSARVLNVVLLGAALHAGALSMDIQDIREAIGVRLPERFHELNLRALDYTDKQ
jgi:indolepyruvate ferredoxin oxidoreductase beta subunit